MIFIETKKVVVSNISAACVKRVGVVTWHLSTHVSGQATRLVSLERSRSREMKGHSG